MRILSLAELDALPLPEWIIDGLIPEAGFAVPYGPPKSGKTFVMLAAGLHVAAGLPWCGKTVKQGAVVYIAGEGTGGLSLRLKAMQSALRHRDRCAVLGGASGGELFQDSRKPVKELATRHPCTAWSATWRWE